MNNIKPKKLKRGDLIGIISPASATDDTARLEKGIRYIEGMGYRTLLGINMNKQNGYLAGTDKERLEDIHDMFGNKKIKAIFCLRGGYGAFRLLDKIDYKFISKNPKIFVGFSEITSLHMAFLSKAKLITFAGPMILPNFSSEVNSFTEDNFWKTISSSKLKSKVNIEILNGSSLTNSVKIIGKVVGGNLAVLSAMIGTGYLPNFKNKILLLEEISEPPYKIDRMLNQLRLHKIFDDVKGIILGNFIDCIEQNKNKNTVELTDVLSDYFESLNIPVVKSFPFGHSKDIITLSIGCKIEINLKKGIIEFSEAGVK